jgi:hypothetical protein
VLYIDKSPNETDVLRSVALMRLMLDTVDVVSLADFSLNQRRKFSPTLQAECVRLGVNLL